MEGWSCKIGTMMYPSTHNIKRVIYLTVLCAVLLLLASYIYKPHVSIWLLRHGATIAELKDFVIYGRSTDNEAIGVLGNNRVRVIILEKEDSDSTLLYIKDQGALFESAYESRLPPYPEFLTRDSGCADRYKPQKTYTANGLFFTTYASERFGYGVCADENIEYKAGAGFFSCDNKAFAVEYFINKNSQDEEIERFFNGFSCVY